MANIDFYQAIRPDVKKGDVFEWESESFLGKSIRKATGYDVNHTSQAVIYNELYQGLPYRLYTLEALSRGIELNLMSDRLDTYTGKVYWLKLKDDYDDYRNELTRIAHERIGTPYDYGAIKKLLFFILRFGLSGTAFKTDIEKLYCSEYVYKNGIDAGLPKPDCFEKRDPVPGELIKTGWYEKRKLIYAGIKE